MHTSYERQKESESESIDRETNVKWIAKYNVYDHQLQTVDFSQFCNKACRSTTKTHHNVGESLLGFAPLGLRTS